MPRGLSSASQGQRQKYHSIIVVTQGRNDLTRPEHGSRHNRGQAESWTRITDRVLPEIRTEIGRRDLMVRMIGRTKVPCCTEAAGAITNSARVPQAVSSCWSCDSIEALRRFEGELVERQGACRGRGSEFIGLAQM